MIRRTPDYNWVFINEVGVSVNSLSDLSKRVWLLSDILTFYDQILKFHEKILTFNFISFQFANDSLVDI